MGLMRRQLVTAGVIASVILTSGAAFAAPCGPAVLANVDGQVLVNRGAGFMSGTAGMPLAVGDYVMSRGGNAEIAYANGGAASLKGAKSMPITACSADAGNLTDPALAQFAGSAGGAGAGTGAGAGAGAGGAASGFGAGGAAAGAGAAGAAAAGSLGVGAAAAAAGVAAAAAVGVAVAASSSSSSGGTVVFVSP